MKSVNRFIQQPSTAALGRPWMGPVVAASLLVMLSACASVPPAPTQQLQAAELAISTAEKAGVADYASPELTEARNNLRAAEAAVVAEDMVGAQRLAERARLDAELATAKSDAAKAKVVNDEMRKSIDTLKQEMQRNTGARS